jgi:hypothetical protein
MSSNFFIRSTRAAFSGASSSKGKGKGNTVFEHRGNQQHEDSSGPPFGSYSAKHSGGRRHWAGWGSAPAGKGFSRGKGSAGAGKGRGTQHESPDSTKMVVEAPGSVATSTVGVQHQHEAKYCRSFIEVSSSPAKSSTVLSGYLFFRSSLYVSARVTKSRGIIHRR